MDGGGGERSADIVESYKTFSKGSHFSRVSVVDLASSRRDASGTPSVRATISYYDGSNPYY